MQVRKGTITGDLKLTLRKLNYPVATWVFSDPCMNKRAVSVKMTGRRYTPLQVQCVVQEMEKLGHKFVKDSDTSRFNDPNKRQRWRGHRLVFWKGDVYCKNLEKVLE